MKKSIEKIIEVLSPKAIKTSIFDNKQKSKEKKNQQMSMKF